MEDGFAQYKNMILDGHGQQLRVFLEEQVQENGWQDSWVDFYYGTLSETEREKARSVLTEEQKSWLDGQDIGKQDLYFQMDAALFEITYRLSITGDAVFYILFHKKYHVPYGPALMVKRLCSVTLEHRSRNKYRGK